jgi:hypothetical protein
MQITRTSPLTGKANVMDLDVTWDQMNEFVSEKRRLVQQIFPDLSQSEREFIKTGYTQEDWDTMFNDSEY